MNVNLIKNHLLSRVSKKDIWVSLIAYIAFNIFFMVVKYQEFIKKINESTEFNFGVSISSEYGFFEALSSAQYSYFKVALFCIIFMWLPLISIFILRKYCVNEEKNIGWKRSAMIVPWLCAILGSISQSNLELVFISSIWYFLISLTLIAVLRWIKKGFDESK